MPEQTTPAKTADLRRYALTPQEETILPYAIGPMDIKEIATMLQLTPEGAKAQVRAILDKTQTPSRRALRLLLVGDERDAPAEDDAPEDNA